MKGKGRKAIKTNKNRRKLKIRQEEKKKKKKEDEKKNEHLLVLEPETSKLAICSLTNYAMEHLTLYTCNC